jgi:hypothetical protein
MGSDPLGAFAGLLVLLAIIAGFIQLIFLFWAPLKLYGIHKEAKYTNVLLAHIISRHDAQCNVLAANRCEERSRRSSANSARAVEWPGHP